MTRTGAARETQQQQPPPAVVGPSSGVFDSTSGNEFFDLQREAGNRVVGDWLKARVNNSAFQEIGTPNHPIIQRKPANNASENQADSAAEQKIETGGVARSLIVEDDAQSVEAGQMRKSEFLTELRTATTAAAEETLAGTMWSAMGCPYIERWFTHYEGQSAQHVERAVQRYTPEARGARNARDYIPIVTNRLRRGIEQWQETGEVPADMPEEFAGGEMPGMTAGALMGGLVGGAVSAIGSAVSSAASSVGRALFKEREGGAREANDPAAIKAQLGSGRSLDATSKSHMESAYGADFSNVRIHTDAKAHELSNSLNARAFTIGSDIAFGSGEYNPGTPIGDALIAHELAHVVQQGSESSAATPLTKGGPSNDGLEEEADLAAAGAVISVWGDAESKAGKIQTKARPRRRSGLQLQRCSGTKQEVKQPKQEKAVSPEDVAKARFRSAKVLEREEKLAEAGKSLRELGTWVAAEQRRQGRPEITAVVGLDPKHRENARQAVINLQAIGPTFETKGLDSVSTKLQEAVKNAKSAKKYIGSDDPSHQLEFRGDLSRAGDSLDEAVTALEKLSDSVDGYELWKEIEDARSLLHRARGGGEDAYDAIEAFDEKIKAIRTQIRELQEKYKRYPQAIARIAFVVQYFVALNTPGFKDLPTAAEIKKFKGTLAGGLSSDFALVFGGGGVHSPFEVFISYADILEQQLAVLEKMSAAGKPSKTPIPAQGEVEDFFKSLKKKSNKEVRAAYEQYARAYFYHRIVTTVEDMAVKDVADLYKRDLSIAGTRPLVCSGYAILGAHLFTLAGGKVTKFITAVRATDDDIRKDTIDAGHAVAEISRDGKKFFVSNDSIFDTEKEAFDVAWGNAKAPLYKASGPTNPASLAALKAKLAKKLEQLDKKR